jgi:hypothetical protein
VKITESQLRRIVRASLLRELRSASGDTVADVASVVTKAIKTGDVDVADEDAIQKLIDTQLDRAGAAGGDRVEWEEQVWSRLP